MGAIPIASGFAAALLALAAVAHAAVSSIDPASGETTPGGTVTATVTVDSGILTCLTATAPDDPVNITVSFDGSVTTCRSGVWSSEMVVETTTLIAPGVYTINVEEVSLEEDLLDSQPWELTVIASDTTTTLLPEPTLPTVTLAPTTTTTTLATGTTIGPTTATSSPTTEPAGDSSDDEPTGVSTTSSTRPAAPIGLPEDGEGGLAAGQPPDSDDDEPFSEIAVSSGLIEFADRALPPVFAQAVLSPLVILEVLLRALARTTVGLIVPLAVTVALGFGLARRLRRDAEELPDLADRVEIPVEEPGEDET